MNRILSLSGGGIRGVITASVLVGLEHATGKLTRDSFEFVAGTSVGALIAAAVAVGIPATRILAILLERSREIFTPGEPWATMKWLASGAKYDPANIAKVLTSEFGARSRWTLNDCPIRMLLTAMSVDGHPWYFVRDTPQNRGEVGSLLLIDCATSSACAPTYFKPWPMIVGGVRTTMFDGGVGTVGNPVHQACIEAFEYDVFTPGGTRVLSLGTGFFRAPPTLVKPGYAPADAGNPGDLFATIKWTVDTLADTPRTEQTELVDRYYPGILTSMDWRLPRAIDMADLTAIPDLAAIGREAAKQAVWPEWLVNKNAIPGSTPPAA